MKRPSGIQEEDDDDDNGKDNMNIERLASRPQLPSTGQESSTATTITTMANVDVETMISTTEKIKATTVATNVNVVDVNDYCNKEKGIISTETSQNPKNDKITHRMIQKNEEKSGEDAFSDDDDNSNVSDDSISDRPGAFAIKGPRFNNNNTTDDGTVQYSTTDEAQTDTHNEREEEEAGKTTINDPLEAERVLETVQGTSVNLDQNNSPRKWKQLSIILGIFVFMLCAVAAVLIAFFVRSKRNSSKSLPPPPTSHLPVVATVASPSPADLSTSVPSMIPLPATTSVQQQIITLIFEYFPDLPASNDQQRALDWILTDPTSLGVITEEGMTSSRNKELLLLERFVLATIYFATNGIGWQNNDLWLSPLFVCGWHGVNCRYDETVEQPEVANLDLNNHNLIGSIPTGVGLMTSMTRLDLSNNALTGSIPTELGSMTNMTWLDLNHNALSGSIPTELGSMTSMTELYLWNNVLSGLIPTELGFMTRMEWLSLFTNALSGSIPTELGSMTSVLVLYLENNLLFGSIPTELGLMTNLKYLFLDHNILTGTIPTEVGLLTRLTAIGLSGNANLTGTIPSEVIAILPNLQGCFMGNTSLIDVPENVKEAFEFFVKEENQIVFTYSIHTMPVGIPNFFKVDISSHTFTTIK